MNDSEKKIENIRNFAIIAHVDHGKSTLADRILQLCGAVEDRDFQNQLLDNLSIERERGITIKAQTVRLKYKYKGMDFLLNLIDTPGHSDFSYEVSRSLFAVENSLLLIDATKGSEAQTISNLGKAQACHHKVIPVLNKIDLPTANLEQCFCEIEELGLDISEIQEISAKSGIGVKELIEFLIDNGRCPVSTEDYTRALVIDSWYDNYLGVVTLIRVFDGQIKNNTKVRSFFNGRDFEIKNVGVFLPKHQYIDILNSGEIGFITTNVKNPSEFYIGDTLYICENEKIEPIPGFKRPLPLVFCTFYPLDNSQSSNVHEALRRYILNDSAFSFELENNETFGLAFRCGFLGLLHMEVVKERLFNEYGVEIIPTMPTVEYLVTLNNGTQEKIRNAMNWPSMEYIDFVEEPEALCKIWTNQKFIGSVSTLCMDRRVEDFDLEIKDEKVLINCRLPLNEIITDFQDKLQSITSGYSSFEYEITGYRQSQMSKLIILINDEVVNEFSMIVHQSSSMRLGNKLVEKLKEIIPRGQIKIKIQAALNSPKNIIARADISPFLKDVIAKCYGGDITRKKKLLEKQKKGKKEMYRAGNSIVATIPSNAFQEIFKFDR